MALAEMGFAGGLGLDVSLKGLPVSDDCQAVTSQLFSESNSRYVVEVEPDKAEAFEQLMAGLPVGCVGLVTQEAVLHVTDAANKTVIKADLATLKEAWQAPLRW